MNTNTILAEKSQPDFRVHRVYTSLDETDFFRSSFCNMRTGPLTRGF